MLCEDCGRNRAVVHITQIGPDGKIEKNLCERCAAKYGEFLMENQKHRNVSMNDFLKGVFSAGAQGEKPQQEKVTELVCPNCGMSYRDFQQTGKIGCSVCYATFRRQLEPLMDEMAVAFANRLLVWQDQSKPEDRLRAESFPTIE